MKLNDSIKSIYNYVISTQIIMFIIFLFYLFESEIDLDIPIAIRFSDNFAINYTMHFNYGSIFAFLGVFGLIVVLSSLSIVGSGTNTEGTKTIKEFIAFLSKYLLLQIPILFLFSKSHSLQDFNGYIAIFLLLIHLINFLEKIGVEKE